jgi:hypothetical protein
MAKKVPNEVKIIQKYEKKQIDYSISKSISYSQTLMYNTCPHAWSLSYVKNLQTYKPSIHTVFGTALHETLQEWLTVLYNQTIKAATEMDLDALLLEKMHSIYKKEKERFGQHFSTSKELSEFHNDGVEILGYIKRNRARYFSNRATYLVGVEIPLVWSVAKNVFFKGYIDVVLYNSNSDSYTILDIKTSTSGWNATAKKDDKKLAQLLLYKEYLAKQFDIDVDKIDVQYFIVKRKVPDDPEYPAMGRRVQEFKPPSGKIKRGQATTALTKFITDAFDEEGRYIDKEYTKVPSKSNCMFCQFKDTEHCNASF